MKPVLKLKEFKTLDLGTKVAVMELSLEDLITHKKRAFTIESTGMSFRVIGNLDSSQLFMLADWLREDSKKDNLRTNRSEIILFAKNMIKINEQLNESVTL